MTINLIGTDVAVLTGPDRIRSTKLVVLDLYRYAFGIDNNILKKALCSPFDQFIIYLLAVGWGY